MEKPSLLIIFLTVFIDLIGFGIVLPLLPVYAEQFGITSLGSGLVTYITGGLIVASYSVMQFLLAPWWGKLSDRVGRRPSILISTAGSALSYVVFGVASLYSGSTGLWLLLLSRVLAGACGANLSVASAYIADITSEENRSKGMGLIGMAFGFGFILGPTIGAISAKLFGLSGPGWVAATFCGLNFVLACFILVESRDKNSPQAPDRPKLEQWIHTLKQPKMGLLIGLYALAIFCFTFFEITLPLYLTATFGYDETEIGYLFAYCGLVTALIQGGVIGRLVRRYGEPRLIVYSLVGIAISLVLLPLAKSLATLLLALGAVAAVTGINRPPTMGMISKIAPKNEQGSTLGVAQSAGTLARCFGPLGATTAYAFHLALPFYVGAGIALIGALIALQLLIDRKQRQT